MRELPILMSAPMVRAILDGRKTVTRRVMKPQPHVESGFWCWSGARWSDGVSRVPVAAGHSLAAGCPYGQLGDRLWVKEAWRVARRWDGAPPSALPHENGLTVAYAAGGSRAHDDTHQFVNDDAYSQWHADWIGRTRSPIHMPRWASRITLEVTDVRVERLHAISEQSAWDEGVPEEVASIRGIDEYGPMIDWTKHWAELPAGTKLYIKEPTP